MTFPKMYSNSYTPEKARRYAARGAKWLDKVCPGWTLLIDPKTLNLQSGAACVLGQTAHCVTNGEVESGHYDSYSHTLDEVFHHKTYTHGDDDIPEAWARAHGFNIQFSENWSPENSIERERYAMLGCAWQEEIAKRSEESENTNV